MNYLNWLTISSGLPITETSYLDIANFNSDLEPPIFYETEDHPVKKEKLGFRLPSSIEWLFAARSGVKTEYPFGSDESLSVQYAWNELNLARSSNSRVRQLRPNLGGLFDVNGNLLEWVQDYSTNSKGTKSSYRLLFGGGFEDKLDNIERFWELGADEQFNEAGFRVVQSVPSYKGL